METLLIRTPREFNFQECLAYLGRSSRESLHYIEDGKWIKALSLKNQLVTIEAFPHGEQQLTVRFAAKNSDKRTEANLVKYIVDLFDLATDLKPFYEMANQDALLKQFVQDHYGLRLIGIPDLFEAFAWAIIGQQINLDFAYSLKRRLVTQFGESVEHEGRTLYIFPTASTISKLKPADLTALQFSYRKAEYIIGVAQAIRKKELVKEDLQKMPFDELITKLKQIRGVGNWTANYIAMKCLKNPNAFPAEDVGLHNALKRVMNLEKKPEIDMIRELGKSWDGWQAYVTFYFWQTLLQYA